MQLSFDKVPFFYVTNLFIKMWLVNMALKFPGDRKETFHNFVSRLNKSAFGMHSARISTFTQPAYLIQ